MSSHQLNVQAATAREQSIVLPTLPGNVLTEFEQTMAARNAAPQDNNPFNTVSSQPLHSQLQSKDAGGIQNVRPAVPAVPSISQAQNQSVQSSHGSFVPRIDYSQESSGILSRSIQKNVITSASIPAETKTTDTSGELINTISRILRKRHESGNTKPYTVGEISAEIKTATQKSWGGYWVSIHGPLAAFLRKNGDSFTIIRNKFVVPAGMESHYEIPALEPFGAISSEPSSHQTQSVNAFNPALSQLPLNQLAQQQHQQQNHAQSSVPGHAYNPYEPQQYLNNSSAAQFAGQSAYNSYDQQVHYGQNPYQTQQIIPNNNSLVPQPQSSYNAAATQIDDPFFNQPPALSTGLEGQMQQLQVNTDFNNPNPFEFTAPSGVAQPGQLETADDFWNLESSGVDDNPLAAFETPTDNAGSVAEAERREQMERQRRDQESADAAYARKLQEEEYAAAKKAEAQVKGTSTRSTGKKHSTRIVYDAKQIREIAENEIGRDNVRIMAGFSVIKYGREGRPKQRKMWINSSLTHLAWESGQYDGSHRGLELAKVRGIRVGEMTKTISRSTKDYKKVRNLCFSLETAQRTLDLQACSVIQRDSLVAALRKVVEFNHTHKPVRKDRNRTEITVYTD